MKQLIINKSGAQKLRNKITELYQSDIEGKNLGIYPGQWVKLLDDKKKQEYLAHIYSIYEDKVFINVHGSTDLTPENFVKHYLVKAIAYRSKFKNYMPHGRLVFGASDMLNGLIIDGHENFNLVEVNSPAYDQYIDLIKSILLEQTGNPSIIRTKAQVRLDSGIPMLETDTLDSDLMIKENDLKLTVLSEIIQKNGYYYDHRENRLRARRVISSLINKPKTAVDLFSYVGSWGISFLKEGIENVTFVDQANLENNILKNLELNSKEDKGSFVRSDVFKYLEECQQRFDLVCSDPPAFAKSKKSQKRALDGYTKLHAKALKIVSPGGYFIAASCTKYVSLHEFQKTVHEAAIKVNRSISLIDIGIQGIDHPFSDFDANSNYIKYLMYSVE